MLHFNDNKIAAENCQIFGEEGRNQLKSEIKIGLALNFFFLSGFPIKGLLKFLREAVTFHKNCHLIKTPVFHKGKKSFDGKFTTSNFGVQLTEVVFKADKQVALVGACMNPNE